jgi:putative ABC transport system permease protein
MPQLVYEEKSASEARIPRKRPGTLKLFCRMALQNTQRRPTRCLMLVLAVMLGTSAVFASYVVSRGIACSTEQSFARMGADLIVVPADAMVNITSALLTVQPTEATIDRAVAAQVAKIEGVEKVSGQTLCRMSLMPGMPKHRVNVIAFDPVTDFTILPWLSSRLPREMRSGDFIAGGRLAEAPGEEIQPCSIPSVVYGKLGRSGVGPVDESFFATYDTVSSVTSGTDSQKYCATKFSPDRITTLFVRLALGASREQVRFAMARLPGVKVVQGANVVTSTRQTTSVLFVGMLALSAVLLTGSLILVGLLFSAIIAERRREIGVLQAIGARASDVIRMLVLEASFITGLGGTLGILAGGGLLFCFQNTLAYYLQTLHIEFAWPAMSEIAACGAVCVSIAFVVGLVGSFIPAARTTREEPYSLIQRDDSKC